MNRIEQCPVPFRGLNDLLNRTADKIRIIQLNVVATTGCNDLLAVEGQCRQLLLLGLALWVKRLRDIARIA